MLAVLVPDRPFIITGFHMDGSQGHMVFSAGSETLGPPEVMTSTGGKR